MAIYRLQRSSEVAMPIDACWRFFSDPRNLSRITPPALGFTILSDLPTAVHPGMMIEYRVSPLFGIPVRWLTEITQVREPDFFVDEQRVGPYRIWHHEHRFHSIGPARTRIDDLVTYVPPFGPLGVVINRLMIAPQLRRIFDFREAQLANLANG